MGCLNLCRMERMNFQQNSLSTNRQISTDLNKSRNRYCFYLSGDAIYRLADYSSSASDRVRFKNVFLHFYILFLGLRHDYL